MPGVDKKKLSTWFAIKNKAKKQGKMKVYKAMDKKIKKAGY